jgi:hypothetical protein
VYDWILIFENGRTVMTDAERSGRPAFKGLFSKRIGSVEQLSQVQRIVKLFIEDWNRQSALKEEENF